MDKHKFSIGIMSNDIETSIRTLLSIKFIKIDFYFRIVIACY